MKTIWKGTISFGLVSIAIELYSAIEKHSFGFKLLHKECSTPITNKRWCNTCNKEVAWHDVIKGFKLDDGTYFIITPENLKKLKPIKTDSINITEFISYNKISPIYYDQHYYVAPAKLNEKAFFLFIQALSDLDRCAIGRFVMKDKEYACSIMPYSSGMLLTTLNYNYEVKELNKFNELQAPKILPQELRLAKDLIEKLSVDNLDMSQFKDNFAVELQKKLNKAPKGIRITDKEKDKIIEPQKINLIDALRASLKLPDASKINGHVVHARK